MFNQIIIIMKAILKESVTATPIVIDNVKITGRWSDLGEMVSWTAPAGNVDLVALVKVKMAGFEFHVKDGVVNITSRLICTTFE